MAVVALGLVLSLAGPTLAFGGCDKDVDCKENRVCEYGTCVLPPPERDLPRFCCTETAGKLGPYANRGIKLGEECVAMDPTGHTLNGTACY